MTITTGKGSLGLAAVVAIWSVSAIVSLPGLAISPIMGELDHIFPHAGELEIEMLESLPSLMIIPVMLLTGQRSVRGNKLRLLGIGTTIFFLSGVGCMLTRDIVWLIAIGGIMGIGAGMVIPLSTGLIVDYFTGDYRVKQLGISSAINNLTLVLATALSGWLADIEWHLAFVVYLFPLATLLLLPALRNTHPQPEPPEGAQNRQTTINRGIIFGLMLFYFAITYLSLIVTFNTSFLVERDGMDSSVAGIIISIFFLAIMAPGFVLNSIVRIFSKRVNLWALVIMGVGLLVMSLNRHNVLTLILGAAMTGVGYGVMQPIIYDKAATNSPPRLATLALSITMAVNYLAILVAPFIIEAVGKLFDKASPSFGFIFNGIVTLLLALVTLLSYRRSRILGSDD
ncbi:MAG: MFS transporter [Alistipes sp.]|nr:MFS transporter [Alistipes sp.]